MPGRPLTFAEVRQRLDMFRMTISKTSSGEYRVNFAGGSEDSAYYTSDLDDALATGKALRRSSPGDVVHRSQAGTNTNFYEKVNSLADEHGLGDIVLALSGWAADRRSEKIQSGEPDQARVWDEVSNELTKLRYKIVRNLNSLGKR